MHIGTLLICVIVKAVLSRPIRLCLPCDELELEDINIKTSGQIINYGATQTYEASEGNIISRVKYYNDTLYIPDEDDRATKRRVYVELTKTDILISIESIFPDGVDMKYYKVDGHEATKITFYQFLGILHRK